MEKVVRRAEGTEMTKDEYIRHLIAEIATLRKEKEALERIVEQYRVGRKENGN